jgi:hypothetical protein
MHLMRSTRMDQNDATIGGDDLSGTTAVAE